MDVNLAGGGTIAKIMEVGVVQIEELVIAAGKRSEADVGRDEVDDDDLAQEGFQQRRDSRVSMAYPHSLGCRKPHALPGHDPTRAVRLDEF